MLLRLLPLALLCAAALVACGGTDGDGGRARSGGGGAPDAPSKRDERGRSRLPGGVPKRASGTADSLQVSVIRSWARALRRGDVAAASALWAVPSIVQNGTPPLKLGSNAQVRAFNRSLPCGALLTASARAPRGFTIVTVRLTRRRGADCGSGVGASARTAIRVRGGRIVEWYRLPDDPNAPGPDSTTV